MSVFTYTEHFVFFGRQDALTRSYYDDVSYAKFKPSLFMELLMQRFMNVSFYNKYFYYAVSI